MHNTVGTLGTQGSLINPVAAAGILSSKGQAAAKIGSTA